MIADILVKIKPRLSENKRSGGTSLISDLHKLAALAESITQHRPRTNQDWLSVSDTLDREGMCLSLRAYPGSRYMPNFAQESIYGIPLVLSKVAQTTPVEKLLPHVSHNPVYREKSDVPPSIVCGFTVKFVHSEISRLSPY